MTEVSMRNGIILGDLRVVRHRGNASMRYLRWKPAEGTDGEMLVPEEAIEGIIEALAPHAPGLHVIRCDNHE